MDIRLRRPPKQQRSRGRVEEILSAARRLIGEKGIDAVKMREIAALAGGPISSVYQYFPNKSAILGTLFELWTKEWEERIKFRLSEVDSLEQLLAAGSDLLSYFASRVREDSSILDVLNAVQADKTLSDLDLATSRLHAEWFCEAGDRFIPESRRQEFRRATFLMFRLAPAAVRHALLHPSEGDSALRDFQALIRGQLLLLTRTD